MPAIKLIRISKILSSREVYTLFPRIGASIAGSELDSENLARLMFQRALNSHGPKITGQ